MAPPKFYFSLPIANDSFHLQSALAARAHLFPAGLSHKNVSPRRLPRKIRPTTRNLRSTIGRTLVLEKAHLAACGQRRRGNDRAETSPTDPCLETGSAVRPDDDNHHWVRFRKSKCARLDRGDVQPARFLANHAPRLCRD